VPLMNQHFAYKYDTIHPFNVSNKKCSDIYNTHLMILQHINETLYLEL